VWRVGTAERHHRGFLEIAEDGFGSTANQQRRQSGEMGFVSYDPDIRSLGQSVDAFENALGIIVWSDPGDFHPCSIELQSKCQPVGSVARSHQWAVPKLQQRQLTIRLEKPDQGIAFIDALQAEGTDRVLFARNGMGVADQIEHEDVTSLAG